MIKYYEYKGSEIAPWQFSPVSLNKINLLVGASGSGKTRFLNTLFNFSNFITLGKPFRSGKWTIKIIVGEVEYKFEYEGTVTSEGEQFVKSELITKKAGEHEDIIVKRDENEFWFKEQKLPKLEKESSSVTLLKEEDLIQPLYKVFSHGLRRSFQENALKDAVALEGIRKQTLSKLKSKPELEYLWTLDHPIQTRLYFFKEFFPEKYKIATEFFKSVFPSIQSTEMQLREEQTLGNDLIIPIFLMKEKGVQNLIRLSELSSGMQKVLLIITDILSLTGNCIYFIDEYENSLGINAINFLPDFLLNHGGDNQFFITTHHPYLINNMPIKNWLVFNRQGSDVHIKNGAEFEEKFGRSKQKAFIQLMSDPFYTGE